MNKEKREFGAAKLRLCLDIADNPDASPALKMARLGELWDFARNYLPLDAERAVFELSTYRLAYSILHSPYGHLLPSALHEYLNDRRLCFGGGLFVYASIVPADFHTACNVIASALHNGTASKDDIGDKLADIGARQAATADAVDALRAQTTADHQAQADDHRKQSAKLEGVPSLVGQAQDADARDIAALDAYMTKLKLPKGQREVYRLYRLEMTQEQIAANMKCDVRTVRRYGKAINAAFAEAGRPGAIVWGNKKSRSETATKAGWAGGVTIPDDPEGDRDE